MAKKIEISKLPLGTHFYAKYQKRLVMAVRFKDGFFLCGPCETAIPEEELKLIEVIESGKKYSLGDWFFR